MPRLELCLLGGDTSATLPHQSMHKQSIIFECLATPPHGFYASLLWHAGNDTEEPGFERGASRTYALETDRQLGELRRVHVQQVSLYDFIIEAIEQQQSCLTQPSTLRFEGICTFRITCVRFHYTTRPSVLSRC